MLPQGYRELQYLTAATAGPYIQLNNGFDNTDEVEFRFSEIYAGQSTDKYMVSPTTWNPNNNRFAMGRHVNSYTAGYGREATGSTVLKPPTPYTNEDPHTWFYSNRIYTIPELNLSLDCSGFSFGSETDNLKLFYGYNSVTAGSIYHWKHKKVVDGTLTLVEDLVPAERTSDHVLGMYDKVSGNFFTNAGTGTFTAGPEVPHYVLPIEITTSNLLNAEECYGSSKYTYTSSPDKATCFDLPLPNGKYLVETTVPFNDDNTASIFAQNGHITMFSTLYNGVSSTKSVTLDVTSGHLGIGIKTEGDTETYLFPTLESWQNSGYTITVTPAD